jgi:hypothetical protein
MRKMRAKELFNTRTSEGCSQRFEPVHDPIFRATHQVESEATQSPQN